MIDLDHDKLYSSEAAAQLLGLHCATTVRRLCRQQQIRAVRIGRKWMISGREIARVRAEGTDPIGGAA
ncbi:Helix-turn-helix domain protein [Mycolicibacterium conceptionense]|uniref:Helix-turn-helix domain protein n=1 Tax=Mycolicibacterium conceptionense TaxID=451644 RepID=A0A0U1DRW9_9MYCO|nr:helix-turn-helix domain-containing protein [Mycolicibacterium conceptionense]ORV29069.1 hypothetical protein AWB98_06685 [Mycolicibacterium conceptionense]CQD21630.1 Helix-turn-helix domain protein [Mycolicibacterium conceptionense]